MAAQLLAFVCWHCGQSFAYACVAERSAERGEGVYGLLYDGVIILVGDYLVEMFLGYLNAETSHDGESQHPQIAIAVGEQRLVCYGDKSRFAEMSQCH